MFTLKRENQRRILAAEVNWLRRLSGVSKLESRRNEEVRQELGQMTTFVERMYVHVNEDCSGLDVLKE